VKVSGYEADIHRALEEVSRRGLRKLASRTRPAPDATVSLDDVNVGHWKSGQKSFARTAEDLDPGSEPSPPVGEPNCNTLGAPKAEIVHHDADAVTPSELRSVHSPSRLFFLFGNADCINTARKESPENLPSGKDAGPGARGVVMSSYASTLNFTRAGLDILVVDDDDETRQHVVSGLKAAGHLVSEAADAASALAQTAARHFDVIILDRLLPDGDGISLVQQLRLRADATPVLMLTAVGDVDSRVEGIEAGADDYLVKPFAFVELKARLLAIQRRGPRTDLPLRSTSATRQ
jgi:PleD family two-component response regulator